MRNPLNQTSLDTELKPVCDSVLLAQEDGAEEVKPEITGGKDGKKEIYR